MQGAALLAAQAALHAGAGRVYLTLLAPSQEAPGVSPPPDLMLRTTDTLDTSACTLVVGCGGGGEIALTLSRWLVNANQLVLDADALNAIAASSELQLLLRQRPADTTILTPHPLEAARLLGCDVANVQADRIAAAQRLASLFQCAVVLKGSGSVIAAPQQTPHINPTAMASSPLPVPETCWPAWLALLWRKAIARGQRPASRATNTAHWQTAGQQTTHLQPADLSLSYKNSCQPT